jgi:zeaxanthin glucosyltransferase
MGRIVVCPVPERGHVNATFVLAKGLRSRGHDVVYLTGPVVERQVRAQGFDFLPLFEDLFPVDLEQRPDWSRAQVRAKYRQVDERTTSSTFERELQGARPDVVLSDAYWCSIALAAFRLKLPVVTLTPTFVWAPDPDVPPRSTFRVPRGRVSRLSIRLSWYVRDAGAATLRALAVGDRERLRRLARETGYPEEDFAGGSLFAGPPRLTSIPEIALYPRSLDLPRVVPPNVVHAGPSVDLERKEPEEGDTGSGNTAGDEPIDLTPLGFLGARCRPLVFCSLGSRTEASAEVLGILRAVIEGLRLRPEVDAIVATGDRITREMLGSLPWNVRVARTVPQLEVLKRSSVFITHGGLNGVQESILCRVPCSSFPGRARRRPSASRSMARASR